MAATRFVLLTALLALHLAAVHQALAAPQGPLRVRRQLADDNTLQPLDDDFGDEQAREKRKLEGITQAKFGIKNAVLGFVFGKINSLIDSKTRLVETLDRQNIELNKQYGIEAPKGGGLSSLSGIVGQVIGPKLQLLGPKIQAVSSLFGASSGNSGGSGGGSGLGSILSLVTSLSGSSSGGAAAGGTVETVDSDEDDSTDVIQNEAACENRGSNAVPRGAMWKLPAANMGHTSTLLTPTPPSSDWSSRLSNRSPTVQSQLSPKMADTITPSRSRISQTQSGTRGNPTPPGTRVDLSSLDTRSGLSPSDTRASQRTSATGRRSFRGGASREVRQVKKDDDIPVFDRNKVSLDFPGNLFGPSVSLLIRTTKIVGDVIQNSAVRYQSFLRLFRPLFRGPFEIKGLDPPTTTTKTTTTKTTTTTTSVPATDNEVRR